MGPATVRISAENFVTPPEFGGLSLSSCSAGQIGGVRLELIRSAGQTRLGCCYQQVPLRVLPPFHFCGETAALLYLLNPTAGLMDGDAHGIEIAAGQGTRTVVTGQSATRIHPCPKGFSTQQWTIRAAADSQLVLLPGPAIPFQGARSFQRVAVDLAPEAQFIWAETWHPGRYERGALSERFQFRSLIQELEVKRGGEWVFRDRFHWQGPWDAATARWFLGGRLACGNVFATGRVDRSRLPSVPDVETAAFPLDSGDTIIRCVGPPPAVTRAVVDAALRLAAGWTPANNGSPWLLESHGLARNHWFSAGSADVS